MLANVSAPGLATDGRPGNAVRIGGSGLSCAWPGTAPPRGWSDARTRLVDRNGTEVFGQSLYGAKADTAPRAAVEASLGCGVPTAVADLHEGETVLDLGSGAGADVLISARRVGLPEKASGLDMTEEMLELARANARDAGVDNVEFVKGYIEEIPLAEGSVDFVISNCVINLSADKPQVLPEVTRVLRPGGRFAVPTCSSIPTWTKPPEPTCSNGRAAWPARSLAQSSSRISPTPPGRHRDPRDPPRPRARQLSDRAGPQARAHLSPSR